ncbi:hypothetical protein BGZ81_006411 [Podila clonocystis]|nr:hypothetical protein BGZ81_006411 [Podila clonocystis]
MGQLEASCFAQGGDNTLYALAFGYDLSLSANNAIAALLKSNASPSNPNSLTWQVVSTIRKGELFSFGDGTKIQCVADPNGGFLAWSYRAYRPGLGPNAQARPGGFRYDPTLPSPSATTTGKGGWTNVETPLSYTWTSTSAASDLIYLKDGSSGKYTFYHAYIPGSVGKTFSFGALNTATTPNMMENSDTKWSFDVRNYLYFDACLLGIWSAFWYVDGLRTTATKLFVWGVAGTSGYLFGVGDLPQAGSLPTIAPSLQLGNYTTPVTCSTPVALGDKVYKYCPVSQTHGDEYKIFAWDGIKAQDPIGMSQLPVKNMFTDAIAGIFGDPSTMYMLVQSGHLAPQYGASGFGSYVLKAVALTGGAAGSVLSVPGNITVLENIAFYAGDTGGGGDLGKTVTGLSIIVRWVIGIFGFIFGLGCLYGCIRHKRRKEFVVVEEKPAVLAVHTTTTFVTRL